MACAAIVQVGPARQSFWALADATGPCCASARACSPAAPSSSSFTRAARGGAAARAPADRRPRRGARRSSSPRTAGSRRCAPTAARRCGRASRRASPRAARCALDGAPPRAVRALAVIDDTAGHHARHTEWRWSAGVGEGPDGVALAWNLVSGVNDPPAGSERAVWVDGPARPRRAPVGFAADLSEIRCEDGATAALPRRGRARAQGQPGDRRAATTGRRSARFSGTLPGRRSRWRAALGVMEHHRARW